jgi:hypothetical protein
MQLLLPQTSRYKKIRVLGAQQIHIETFETEERFDTITMLQLLGTQEPYRNIEKSSFIPKNATGS